MVLARYVKVVVLTRNISLWIKDITIKSGSTNLSCFKPTTASSEHTIYDKDNAVDDSNVTMFGSKAEWNRYGYWRVDLGDLFEIDSVVFTKRIDQLALYSSAGTEIQFYTDNNETNLVHTLLLNSTEDQQVFGPEDLLLDSEVIAPTTVDSVIGRIVKLETANKSSQLWISEIEVYEGSNYLLTDTCPKSSGTIIGSSAINAIDRTNDTFAGMYARADRVSYWQVDLKGIHNISKVVFRGRDDVPPNNIYLRIYDNVSGTNLVYEKLLQNNIIEQEITEFSWMPDELTALKKQVDDLQAYVDSLNVTDPLESSGLTIVDVNQSGAEVEINKDWTFIFLKNTNALNKLIEVEVLGSNLTSNNKGQRKNLIFQSKVAGASSSDNHIRIKINKNYFIPPYPVALSTVDYFYFDFRYIGSSLNLLWNGSKWFMLNPGNCIAKYKTLDF